jgi:hypothetical protein
MKLKLDRIISLATLLASVLAIFLVVRRPAPVAQPPAPVVATQPGQSADPPPGRAQQGEQTSSSETSRAPAPMAASGAAQASPPAAASPKSESASRAASDAISGALAKMLGGGSAALTPDSNVGSGEPVIKDQQVSMDGDIVHGKFLTEIAGKDVWVTISGHMGEKDGYATFDPTEIKVGDMNVPVSLVNPALQRKMAEERDRLKIPNSGASQ